MSYVWTSTPPVREDKPDPVTPATFPPWLYDTGALAALAGKLADAGAVRTGQAVAALAAALQQEAAALGTPPTGGHAGPGHTKEAAPKAGDVTPHQKPSDDGEAEETQP